MRSPRADKIVRRTLSDGTVQEYRYPRGLWADTQPRPRIVPGSVEALIDAWQRSPAWADLAPATRATYSTYLRDLAAIGRQPAAEIKRRHIIALRDAIATSRGRGAATGFVRAASAAWAWAIDAEIVETSPAARLRPLKGGELPTWSEAAFAVALDRLPEPYRRVVLLAVHTGQRRGDLIRLPWSAWQDGVIRLRQQKTGTALVVPVHRDLAPLLAAWRRDATATTILAAPSGRPWTAGHLTRELSSRMAALGLGRLTLHGLRKLAAVRLAQAGASAHEIAAIGGWASLSMVQRYTKAADQAALAGAAIVRLENAAAFGQKAKKKR